MKYIRTKDSVYEVVATPQTNKMYENSNCYQVYDSKSCIRKDMYIDEILKQADTIEELCDEFVIHLIHKESKKEYHYEYDDFRALTDLHIKEPYKGEKYGAIWTDEGLIYVAKMNNEGVLELL